MFKHACIVCNPVFNHIIEHYEKSLKDGLLTMDEEGFKQAKIKFAFLLEIKQQMENTINGGEE